MYIVAILFAILLLQLLYCRLWKYKSLRNIPSVENFPIASSGNIDDMFDKMISINKTMGPIVKVWTSLISPKIMVADVDVAHSVLSSSTLAMRKSKLYEHMVPFLGRGLVTAEVPVWKKDRKLTNPAFNLKLLEEYDKVFEYHGNELVNILRNEVNKKSVDVVPFVDLYALDVICESVADVRTHLQRKADLEYLNARSRFLTIVMNRLLSFVKGVNAFFRFTEDYTVQSKCAKVLSNFSKYLIKENNNSAGKSDINSPENFKHIINILTESGFDDKRIVDHINTFIVAGHDTPASTIAFALYEIAQRPEIQNKILEESITILGQEKDIPITKTDMQRMVYLDAVIKEVLRFYPPVAFIERKTDQEISIGDSVIPPNIEMRINIYGLHHSEEYFERPNDLIPDRFLPESTLKMNLLAFMPFSKGPRDCIGKTFAMFQMKSVICKIIRNFELLPAEPKHKLVLTSEFVTKSTTGLKIQLKERNLLK